MSIATNPFYVAGPIPSEFFIGRADELGSIFATIINGGSVAIFGESGVGKSSILKYIMSEKASEEPALSKIRAETWFVYYNCGSLERPFRIHHFWRKVLTETKYVTEDEPELQELLTRILEKDTIEVGDVREVLYKISEGTHKRMLLFLDDFDVIFEEDDDSIEVSNFLGHFRYLAAHIPRGPILSVVTTSFKRLSQIGPRRFIATPSPWYNHFAFVRLSVFKEEEVERLLAKNPFSEEDIHFILKVAGRHPALLQNACFLICNKRKEKGEEPLEYAQLGWEFEDLVRPFFQNFWYLSSSTEQMLMMLIALRNLGGRVHRGRVYSLKDLDIIFSQHEKELRDLTNRGLLQPSDNKEEGYAFSSSLMEWWVIKEVENSKDEIELEGRITIFEEHVSTRQKERLKDIARTVWKNKDAIKDIGRWLIDFVLSS